MNQMVQDLGAKSNAEINILHREITKLRGRLK